MSEITEEDLVDYLAALPDRELQSLAGQARARQKMRFNKKCACVGCSIHFQGTAAARYCSAACKQKAWRYRSGQATGRDAWEVSRKSQRQKIRDKIADVQGEKHAELEQQMKELKLK